MTTLSSSERVALLGDLDALAAQVDEARGALHALLYEPPPSPPLIYAREAARRLAVSEDTVRARGREWNIEVDLGPDLKRYDP
jgi:hypothetical protein